MGNYFWVTLNEIQARCTEYVIKLKSISWETIWVTLNEIQARCTEYVGFDYLWLA